MKKNVPNILTVSRLLLLPVIWYFISLQSTQGTIIACLFIVIFGLTDLLDGYLARHFDAQTHLGRMLDPLADKTGASVILVALVVFKSLPFWYALLVIGRSLFVLAGGAFLILKKRTLVESNAVGKINFSITISVMGIYLLNIESLKRISIFSSTIMLVLSTIVYVWVSVKPPKETKAIAKSDKYRFNIQKFFKSIKKEVKS
jgi:CDP-diacylglycerol--glycerol-3-phosphate 3-phosphatidyltransferase